MEDTYQISFQTDDVAIEAIQADDAYWAERARKEAAALANRIDKMIMQSAPPKEKLVLLTRKSVMAAINRYVVDQGMAPDFAAKITKVKVRRDGCAVTYREIRADSKKEAA